MKHPIACEVRTVRRVFRLLEVGLSILLYANAGFHTHISVGSLYTTGKLAWRFYCFVADTRGLYLLWIRVGSSDGLLWTLILNFGFPQRARNFIVSLPELLATSILLYLFTLLSWRWGQYVPPRHGRISTVKHGVTPLKTSIYVRVLMKGS